MGFILGLGLALLVGLGLQFGAKVFSKDVTVLHLISIGIPVCPISNMHFFLFIFWAHDQLKYLPFCDDSLLLQLNR